MAKFWELLSERGRVAWFLLCQQHGIVISEPTRDERGIQLEAKIEDLEEIDKLMRQKPSGRMGRG